MRQFMLSNFINKRCKIMLCDGNEEIGFLRDFDGKYIFIDTGKMTLIPHKIVNLIKEI